MKRSEKKFKEKFVCCKSEEELKKLQLIRLAFIVGCLALFLVTIFLKQDALKTLVDNKAKLATSVQTIYAVLNIAIALVGIYVVVCSLTRYKIAKEILAENAPKKGFSSTWACFVWLTVLLSLYAIFTVGLMIYDFSVGSLINLILLLCSAVCSFFAIKVGVIAYDNATTLLSENSQGEKEIEKVLSEDVEDFYEQ